MENLIIPFSGEASFTEEITLENTPYILVFNWNSRGSFWEMSFYDRSQNPLALGIKLVLNDELIGKFPEAGLPPGKMYVIDGTESEFDIAFDDFTNGRLSLIYVESI